MAIKCIKLRDGSVWEVIGESRNKKEYLVKSRFRIWIDKRLVVATFEKDEKVY